MGENWRPEADLTRLLRYVAFLPQTGPSSFLAGINRVELGETLVIKPKSFNRSRSWSAPQPDPEISFNEAVVAMRQAIDDATLDRMQSMTGTISAQLSAGMDRSAVFASAARQTERPIYAFTGSPVPGSAIALSARQIADESEIAARTAPIYPNAIQQRVESTLEPTLDFADRWGDLTEQPLRSYGNLGWLEATMRGAFNRGSRHILSGHFGNWSFSYDGYTAISESLLNGDLATWAKLTVGVRRQPGVRWRGAFSHSLPAFLSAAQVQSLRGFLGKERQIDGFADSYLNLSNSMIDDMRRRAQVEEITLVSRLNTGHAERVPAMDWIDIGTYVYGSRARFGIEQRDPTSDRRVLDLSFSLPTKLFIEGGVPRALAIAVSGNSVDPAVLLPNKGVQGQDWHISFNKSVGEMRTELDRLRDHTELAKLFDISGMDNGLIAWQRDPAGARADWLRYELISRTLCAARWARRLVDGG